MLVNYIFTDFCVLCFCDWTCKCCFTARSYSVDLYC